MSKKYIKSGTIINELMATDIVPDAIIDLQGQGQNRVSLQIETTQGSAAPDHVGVVKWDVSNRPDGGWVNLGSYSIASGAEVSRFEDNIITGARFMRVWYDRTSGGADDTLAVTVNHCWR